MLTICFFFAMCINGLKNIYLYFFCLQVYFDLIVLFDAKFINAWNDLAKTILDYAIIINKFEMKNILF
jgi:hypothetical protein